MKKPHHSAVLAALCAALITGIASGHAVINETEAYAGEFAFVTIRITHGCDGQPSTEVRVKIPDGVTRVSPRFERGWIEVPTAGQNPYELPEPAPFVKLLKR